MSDRLGQAETRSTCPYCGVGCGVLLRSDEAGGLHVRGDPDHPANFGKLCSKGSALGETVGLEQRLLSPKVSGQDTNWNEALQLVADRFTQTIAEHGPDSVAFYVSGQLLTEDYYVANKLMKGFIGSANIDTNSRLCMASSVAGHKRAFGTDTVPGTYEDIDNADLVVLVGSNLAWCHPVLYQRLLSARKSRGTKIVVVDPRRTASCDGADLHLALSPGSDVALFNALLAHIASSGAIDRNYAANIEGLDAAVADATAEDTSVTGLSEATLREFCELWSQTENVVTIYSQGVNQSTSGTDKVNAILNCHLATGRIGKPGCGPLSVTGQPNAMGGREVGGLANMLACHLDLENGTHREAVGDFWNAPNVAENHGLKAVEMFEAVKEGDIKALWIIHTNPAVSMPDANAVRDAIAACPFTVVSDITARTDTAQLADVLLPATAWAEKSGTVTNSDRTISRQRKLLPSPGDARPDWDILAEVGRRMGFTQAFDYSSEAEIFREYAALSAISGQFGKDFDISALMNLSDSSYDNMPPQRWPITKTRNGGRFFADGQFFQQNKKARAIPVTWRPPAAKPTPRYPFRLNTGRIRDQWHTMTRTGLSPRLSAHMAEPFLEMHPSDAGKLSLTHADLVKVSSPIGTAILRVRISDAIQSGQVFAPMHWTAQTAPSARIDALIASATDPISGQPESKAAVVSVSRYDADWYGFAVSGQEMSFDCTYWAQARTAHGFRAEFACTNRVEDWEARARQIMSAPDADAISVIDTERGMARVALHTGDTLLGAIYIATNPVAVMRDYVAGLPGSEAELALPGRPPANVPNPGPVLCSCLGVGVNTIANAIQTQGLMTVEQIGEALGAGTNCGSCRPEIADLLSRVQTQEAAE